MLGDRFTFGIGTGENLNEHVTGERWPEHDVRLEMLDESLEVMRKLWTGKTVSHHASTTPSRTRDSTPVPTSSRR